jgi:hypothetical protein
MLMSSMPAMSRSEAMKGRIPRRTSGSPPVIRTWEIPSGAATQISLRISS